MRPFRKDGFEISLEAALEYINDDKMLFDCLLQGGRGFARSLPRRDVLMKEPALTQFFRDILAFNQSQHNWVDNPS